MTYTNSFSTAPRRPSPDARRPARPAAPLPACDAGPYRRDAYRPPRGGARRSYRAAPPAAPRRRGRLAGIALAAALACALAGAAWCAATSLASLAPGAGTAGNAASSGEPQSTPWGDWRQGEVPALYQRDPAWANTPYAGATFGEAGCGPTCLSMAYIALTGARDLSPADAGALSERLGCTSPDGTAWSFMTDGAAELGLAAEELPADELAVRRALNAGRPVICSVGPGDFTSVGHFIVLAGIDGQGRLLVRDPNSPERTAKPWDFDVVLPQCRNLWAYSRA